MKHLPTNTGDAHYERLPFCWNGLEFYLKNGKIKFRKYFDRHTREALAQDPKLENVRKSNREFALCATTAKLFRISISPALMLKIPYLHAQLTGFFRQLLDYDLTQKLGERSFSNALLNPLFLEHFQEFCITPKADYWLSDVIAAISVNNSGKLTVDTAAINFDALEKFTRFEVILGEILFDWKRQSYSHSFTGFQIAYYEKQIYELEPEFNIHLQTQTHFYIVSVVAHPDFELSRKRNKQIEEYSGLSVFLI